MENFFEIIFVTIFGAIFGSYATLFAYRLPRGESCFGRYFGKKSRCPNCNSTIITRDLIPILNWLITLGRCRYCKVKIPKIHLFVELLTTILFIICYLNFGFNEKFIINALIAVTMVVMVACDISHKRFTNQALIFLLFFVSISRVIEELTIINMIYSLLFGVLVVVIFYKLFIQKFTYLFSNEDQYFDYIKLILIASIGLNIQEFLFYFLEVTLILLIFFFLNILNSKKNKISFGYIFIFPLIWMLLIQPLKF
jgi:hypothetical protein